jgi:hypothetical protein
MSNPTTPILNPYTSGVYRVFDASNAPSAPPAPGCQGVLMYIGRPGYTPHVWTVEEADKFKSLRQFPCWVPDRLANPNDEAMAAVKAALGMGWARMSGVQERAIVYDLETAIVRTWYASLASATLNLGFVPVAYGSLSTVLQNAASDNWIAAWDGIPDIAPGQTIHGEQYANDGTYDLSLVDAWMMNRGGTGPRHN